MKTPVIIFNSVYLDLTTLWATAVNTRKSDLTSDSTWVIRLYLVLTFSYIFMEETRTQKTRF